MLKRENESVHELLLLLFSFQSVDSALFCVFRGYTLFATEISEVSRSSFQWLSLVGVGKSDDGFHPGNLADFVDLF